MDIKWTPTAIIIKRAFILNASTRVFVFWVNVHVSAYSGSGCAGFIINCDCAFKHDTVFNPEFPEFGALPVLHNIFKCHKLLTVV